MTVDAELENQVQQLPPRQAWELLERDHRTVIVDVRSSMEFLFIGHAKGAINVPWIDEPDWKVNPHFVRQVRKVMLGGVVMHGDGVAPVMLMCRSGHRSLEAGATLLEDGFERVYSVADGFEGPLDDNHHRSSIGGWRFEGLPWEQC